MNVLPIKLTYQFNQQKIVLFPTLIQTEKDLLLVDCGYEGALEQIKEQLMIYGFDLEQLTGLILSHDDIDHIGGLNELKLARPSLKIYASEIEAPYLSGKKKSLRIIQAEKVLENIPEDQKSWALAFKNSLLAIRRFDVDEILESKKDMQIIPTPGHTPGHISIYFPKEKILVANDAVVLEDGELNIANPQYSLDLPQAIKSVEQIASLAIDEMICYHGGIVTDVSEKFAQLLRRYKVQVT
jgi:glyoxylase-like metal-dependent hydrolase (beta-lactamase superfamily II)